jgi:hypothetical protein
MQTLNTKLLLLTTALALFCSAARAQERPDPERLRAEARELSDKARDLKADGRTEESEKLARKAKNLTLEADELRQKQTDERRPAADVSSDRRDERDVARRSPRGSRGDRDEGQRRIGPPDHLAQGDRGSGRLDREDLALRKFHLKKAIKHLRAAGLYEQADRLEERMRPAHLRFRDQPRGRQHALPQGPRRPERQPLERDRDEQR